MGCSNSLEIEESENDKIKDNQKTSKKLNENGIEDESEHSKDKIYKKNKFTSNGLDPIIFIIYKCMHNKNIKINQSKYI